MPDKLYLRSITLTGKNSPTWTNIPVEIWRSILSGFFYKISSGFAFGNVQERSDLFPRGLTYFNDWDLKEVDLIEFHDNTVLLFELNNSCKLKILDFNFSAHSEGMTPPRQYRDYDSKHYYYEFDELCFYSGNRLIGIYINHENMIEFKDLYQDEIDLLNQLDHEIRKDIIDSEDFTIRPGDNL